MFRVTYPKKMIYRAAKRLIRWHDGFSYDISVNGEKWLLEKTADLKFRTIFDVGANRGVWTKHALNQFPDSHIHCFEVCRETFTTLRENLRGNKCTLNNFALSDITSEIRYKYYQKDFGSNTIICRATYHDKRIKPVIKKGYARRGDDYCDSNGIEHIDLLKIDVEGADHLVLHGFSKRIATRRVRLIQFEYGYTHGDSKFLMRDFYEFFEKNGYAVGKLRHGRVEFTPWNYHLNDFDSGPNYVAVRLSDRELICRISG